VPHLNHPNAPNVFSSSSRGIFREMAHGPSIISLHPLYFTIPDFLQIPSLLPVPHSKKQQRYLVRVRHLRKCAQRVEELSASAVKLIMQWHSQLSEEELIGVQDLGTRLGRSVLYRMT
jgi:hypothetical protein